MKDPYTKVSPSMYMVRLRVMRETLTTIRDILDETSKEMIGLSETCSKPLYNEWKEACGALVQAYDEVSGA